MPENKTAVVNLGEGMIYKITVPDPDSPNSIEIEWIAADGTVTTKNVTIGGID